MHYVEHRPRPELAPYLECLWEVSDPRARPRAPERIVPDGCPELIVHLRDCFARRVGRRWIVQPRAFLAGTLTQPWFLRAGRRIRTFGIRFRPGATTAVIPVAMAAAVDRERPLRDLVGHACAHALTDALGRARTAARRVSLAESWLLERVAERPASRDDVRDAVAVILQSRGQAQVANVARALGWSRRRLERVFKRGLGIRPKLYARIVRLNAALATLDEAERSAAVDFALEAGYFDQAHLLRDFRLLAGRTPRVRREDDGEMSRHFTRPERLRALLAGD